MSKEMFGINHKMDHLPDEFGGYPVEEAVADLIVRLQHNACGRGAIPGSSTHCAFAVDVKEIFQSPFAWFWKTWAYIVFPNDKGELIAWRYVIPSRTMGQIIKFDEERIVDPGGYLLKAPTPGVTLQARRNRDRQYRKDVREGKRVPGTKPSTKKVGREKKVRVGTGQVRFAQEVK
jgi:hypothetical protein